MRRAFVVTVTASLLAVCGAAPHAAGGARPAELTGPELSAASVPALPEPLAEARQLLLVTTPDWNTVAGELRRFERAEPGASWTPVAAPVRIVVGRNGMAWDPTREPVLEGPTKREGDGRSPAGVFTLGTAFGLADPGEAGWLKLPYVQEVATLECVDDPGSRHYNQLVDRATVPSVDWTSSEKMAQVGEAYRWGVVVNYNTPAVAGRGSCIFLHIGGEGGRGTAGCTAMAPDDLRAVMAWLDPARAPVLVQLPAAAHDAIKGAWALP
jgi:D-alanyl-D-alanine dipeptidase